MVFLLWIISSLVIPLTHNDVKFALSVPELVLFILKGIP